MLDEKKKKAIMVAVARFIEEEQEQNQRKKPTVTWSKTGRGIMMSNRIAMQRRGKLL